MPQSEGARCLMAEDLILQSLIEGLFKKAAIEEVEPLISRYRETALAKSARDGHLCSAELRNFYFSSRLHEVPCI